MKDKTYTIAIMYYAPSPYVMSLKSGFLERLDQLELSYKTTLYDCNGNQGLIKPSLEDVIDKSYDLLFSIGTTSTVAAKELTEKKMNDIPIIFTGLGNPEELNLIESRENSGNNLTGIVFDMEKYCDMGARIEVLFEVRPDLKTVLIPLTERIQIFHTQAALLEKAIIKESPSTTVIKLPIKAVSEIIEKVKSLGNDIDAIISLRDGTVLTSLEGLVKLCNLHGITLYTSELDSVKKGAGIGYGQDEYDTGVACAEQAYQILAHKKKPREIPIQSSFNAEVHINATTKDLQGLASFEKSKARHPLLKKARLIS